MVEEVTEDPLVEMTVDETLIRPIGYDIFAMVAANLAGLAVVALLFVVGKL